MKVFFITFRSITHAQRGERTFVRAGIKCHMRRTPRWMEERGCGYGLEVTMGELSGALALLKEQGIPWRKTWLLHSSGEVEELRYDLS